MAEFIQENSKGLIIVSSLLLLTVLTSIIITASGKVFVLEFDDISGFSTDGEGNFRENHIDGGKLRFYAD